MASTQTFTVNRGGTLDGVTTIDDVVKGGSHEIEARKKWLGGLGMWGAYGLGRGQETKGLHEWSLSCSPMTEATRVSADKRERGGHLVSPA